MECVTHGVSGTSKLTERDLNAIVTYRIMPNWDKFYANNDLNGVLLALFASFCWSFYDMLSGLVRTVNGFVINIVVGATMFLICTVGISTVWRQVVSVLNDHYLPVMLNCSLFLYFVHSNTTSQTCSF